MIEFPWKKKPPFESIGGILPASVRYALKYRGAKMGIEEISDLNKSGFELEAFYLLLKAAAVDAHRQSSLLANVQKAMSTLRSQSDQATDAEIRKAVHGVIEIAIRNTPVDTIVHGTKLAQLSRQGFEHWEQLYRQAANNFVNGNSELFVIGHSTAIGLPVLMYAYLGAGRSFSLFIPPFIEDESNPNCGYVIEPAGIHYLPKDFPRPANAVVLDDTKKTGRTEDALRNFWNQQGTADPQFATIR